MRIIGLDTATNRWHAMVDDERPAFCSELKGKDWDTPKPGKPIKQLKGAEKRAYSDAERQALDAKRRQLSRTFRAWLLKEFAGQTIAIYCEEPLALQNGKTTRLLSLSAGALWNAALQLHDEGLVQVEWHWVDVALWKKEIVGNGNADKAMIRDYVLHDVGPEIQMFWDSEEDLYDAYCLMQFGLQAKVLA